MKTKSFLALSLSLLMSSFSFNSFATQPQGQDAPQVIENEFIMKLKDNGNAKSIFEFQKGKMQTLYHFQSDNRLHHVKSTTEDMKNLQKNYGQFIEYIEPVYRVWADSSSSIESTTVVSTKQWGLENPNNIDVDILKAWEFTQGTSDVVVAVVDSGIDYKHPDLKNNIWNNEDEIPANGIDDDHNGYVDDVMGWDFYGNDAFPYDYAGHGTHVSGIIAADGAIVKGVAPQVRIMPLRFLGANGSGSTAGAIKAIDYAANNGAKVINASWGGGGYSQALRDVIARAEKKGVLFVTSAGNNGSNIDINKSYPASYNLSNMVVVASVTSTGALNSFSNYGVKSVQVGAPGNSIYSTYLNGKYTYLSGTSMASPFAAGIVALIWSYFPELSAMEVKDLLLQSVKPLNSLKGKTTTGGMVNAGNSFNH